MDKNTVRTTGNSSGIIAIANVIPDKILSIILSFNSNSSKFKNVNIPTKTNKINATTAHDITNLSVCA